MIGVVVVVDYMVILFERKFEEKVFVAEGRVMSGGVPRFESRKHPPL